MNRLPLVPSMASAPAPLLDGNDPWQMGFGERAAIVGILAELRPALAIEIGTAEGGSLRRIAEYSGEVHSFDLFEPDPDVRELENVTLHTGDSHALLPTLLAELAREGRNVDFVLVDGDHSAAGVAQDMRDLLNSPAIGRTVIVMHDSMNEEVRRGLDDVDYSAWPKVRYVELDCVAGFLFRDPLENELWGGLALVVVDADRPREPGESPYQRRYHAHHPLMVSARDGRVQALAELDALRHELASTREDLERHRGWLASINASVSWRITAPLRRAKAWLKR
jgi:hypothetical protein